MTLLMIGSGGREHALIRAFKDTGGVDRLLCAPGNGGISCDADCFPVSVTDIDGMVSLAREQGVDTVFVAPDDPLAAGMVDRFEAEGFRAFGPTAAAARIESSKVFSKELMKKYGIPTAGYEVFTDAAAAVEYIRSRASYPAVIKADGLALGKGVVIAENFEAAQSAVKSMMEDKVFGESGSRIVVEDFLTGPEVSVLAFTDGKTVRPMVSSMDHKRAHDGDTGLNTGGMGTVSPNPYYTDDIADVCRRTIFEPTISAMRAEGCPFKGCLYFGLMLTPDGPKVIEYNSRFGDPEAQVVLPRLVTPLIDIVDAVIDERLDEIEIKWSDNAAACVIIASGGYPEKYEKGKAISGLGADGQVDGATVYHAGTKLENGVFLTAGGRVLGVTATGSSLLTALDSAYTAAERISFEGSFYRHDIGQKAILAH